MEHLHISYSTVLLLVRNSLKNMVLICAFGKTLEVTLLQLEKENKSYMFSI